jgi:hypothetical protein
MTLAFWLAMAGAALTREPVANPSYFSKPQLSEVNAKLGQAMQVFHATGDKSVVQQVAGEAVESTLKFRGGLAKHFPQGIPDVTEGNIWKIVPRAVAGSPSQQIGYLRELKNLKAIQLHGAFQIVNTNEAVSSRFGRTEIDEVLRHKSTGEMLRMESKEVLVTRSNMPKYEAQITKQGMAARESGQRAILVDRLKFSPAIRTEFSAYARANGVEPYDGISTGTSARWKPIASVLDKESQIAYLATASRWVGRGGIAVMVGVSIYDVYQWQAGQISTQEFAARGTGTVAAVGGAWAGAEGGGTLGATIGTFIFPGVGTVIGGAIGGVLGGFGGGALAYWAGENAVNGTARMLSKAPELYSPREDMTSVERTALLDFMRSQYAAR